MIVFAVTLVTMPAFADSPWVDPKNGCGKGGAFAKSGKAEDLPGCSGKLPKEAPPIEHALREAKRALIDAEESMEKNKLEKLDEQLAAVEKSLASVPPPDPAMPDRWEMAQPHYQRAIAELRNRRRLAGHLEKLRGVYRAVAESRGKNNVLVDGGPVAAMRAAEACIKAFGEARADKVELTVIVELEKDRKRPLAEALAECESQKRQAEPRVRAQDKSKQQKRATLRKRLKGERLKVFDEHPTALPEISGDTWKYATGEVYTWKGNKLVSKK